MLGVCAALTILGPASAVVRYELQTPVYRDNFLIRDGNNPCRPNACTFPTSVTFTVSDAALDRGNISVSGRSAPLSETRLSGDAADLVDLQVASDRSVRVGGFYGIFDLRVSFAADQAVTDFFLNYDSDERGLRFRSIVGNIVSTDVLSDAFQPCGAGLCFITGRIEVSEPASMTLLGFGLLGIGSGASLLRRGQHDSAERLDLVVVDGGPVWNLIRT